MDTEFDKKSLSKLVPRAQTLRSNPGLALITNCFTDLLDYFSCCFQCQHSNEC